MMHLISSRLRRFARRDEGTIAVETMLWVPLLLSVLAATFSLHDAFRYKSLNVKAAYTISDALSRETDPIDNAYLDGMVQVMEFLTRSDGPYSLRVTLVRYNETEDRYIAEWSKTRGQFDTMGERDLTNLYDKLPTMLHNERVIVVETESQYSPPFEVAGLSETRLFYNFGFTRPRFAPKIVWAD